MRSIVAQLKTPEGPHKRRRLEGRTLQADAFDHPSEINDFCFVVEGKSLYAPKGTLASLSPVFHKLCFEKSFKEAKDGRAVLKEDKYADLREMLACTIPHPSIKKVNQGNMWFLFGLAKKYLIRSLFEECQECLYNVVAKTIRNRYEGNEDLACFLSLALENHDPEHDMDEIITEIRSTLKITHGNVDLLLSVGQRYEHKWILCECSKFLSKAHRNGTELLEFLKMAVETQTPLEPALKTLIKSARNYTFDLNILSEYIKEFPLPVSAALLFAIGQGEGRRELSEGETLRDPFELKQLCEEEETTL